ncbi:MAG: hypothetical protein J0I45_06885 [Bosea sp.]|nr:hypothetical protein [Bosea sp. (in: a-proteobacteria)]
MCGLCGSFTDLQWSAVPTLAARPALGRARLAEAASKLAADGGVRVSAWGQGFRVTGPTGRTELVGDLAALWAAVDRLGRASPDPLENAS